MRTFLAKLSPHSRDGLLWNSPTHHSLWKQFVQENEGKTVRIELPKKDRSDPQLRMYWAWVHKVASDTGNTEDELHEFLLSRCAPKVLTNIKGKKGTVTIEQYKRTSGGHVLSMNKEEMGEYMDKCAALTNYPLPTPEELEAMGYIRN